MKQAECNSKSMHSNVSDCGMLLLSFTIVLVSVCAIDAKSVRLSASLKSMSKDVMQRDIDNRCLDCICQKESGCKHNQGCAPNPPPNGEMACGPFQIRKSYFQACCNMLSMGNCDSDSAWQTCAKDYNCAVRCVTVCQIFVSTNREISLFSKQRVCYIRMSATLISE